MEEYEQLRLPFHWEDELDLLQALFERIENRRAGREPFEYTGPSYVYNCTVCQTNHSGGYQCLKPKEEYL